MSMLHVAQHGACNTNEGEMKIMPNKKAQSAPKAEQSGIRTIYMDGGPYRFSADDLLAICRRMLDDDTGCDTPAENFIYNLLLAESIRPLTPDDAALELGVFRKNFEDATKTTRYMANRYPEHLDHEKATAAAA